MDLSGALSMLAQYSMIASLNLDRAVKVKYSYTLKISMILFIKSKRRILVASASLLLVLLNYIVSEKPYFQKWMNPRVDTADKTITCINDTNYFINAL
jgi:hypothetical protein